MSDYEFDKKTNMTMDEDIDPAAMAQLIDKMMAGGVSRLKLKESDTVNRGEILKEYHHGRCDINSPWACGKAFDVLE